MRGPFYILLALALLGLAQECAAAADAQDELVAIKSTMIELVDIVKDMKGEITRLTEKCERMEKSQNRRFDGVDNKLKHHEVLLKNQKWEYSAPRTGDQTRGEEEEDYSRHDDDEKSEDIYNPQFNANNVIEFDIDVDIVKKVLAEYEADVAPLRESGYSSDDICVVDPYKTVWKEQGGGVYRSNAVWYSPRNRETFEKYLRIVEEIGLEDIFRGTWIDSDKVSVLSMFFLVRNHCGSLNMHLDWPEPVHTNIISVLFSVNEFGVHFAYTDNDGNLNHYKYEVGKAIGFGGGFLHSTDVGVSDHDDILFNIYLGAAEIPDDPDMWYHFLWGTDDELQRYMHPSKGFVEHEWYKNGKDICVEDTQFEEL